MSELNKIRERPEDLTFERDIVIVLQEISEKLSILIKYESILHKIDLEEGL